MKKRFFAWLMVFVLIFSFFQNSLILRASSPDEQNLFFNVKFYEQKKDGSYVEYNEDLGTITDTAFDIKIHKKGADSSADPFIGFDKKDVLFEETLDLNNVHMTSFKLDYNELELDTESGRRILPYYGSYETSKRFYHFNNDPVRGFEPNNIKSSTPSNYYISVPDESLVKHFTSSGGGTLRFMSIFPTYQSTDSDFESRKNHFTLAFLVLPNNEGYPLGRDQIRVYSHIDYHGENGGMDSSFPDRLAFNFYHRDTSSQILLDGSASISQRNNEKSFLYNYAGNIEFQYYPQYYDYPQYYGTYSPLKEFRFKDPLNKDPLNKDEYYFSKDTSFSEFPKNTDEYFAGYSPYSYIKTYDNGKKRSLVYYLVKDESRPPKVDYSKKELEFKAEIFRAVKPSVSVFFDYGFENRNKPAKLRGRKNFENLKNKAFSKEDVLEEKRLNKVYSALIDTSKEQLPPDHSFEDYPFYDKNTDKPLDYYQNPYYLPYISYDDAKEIYKRIWDEKEKGFDYSEMNKILQVDSFVDPDTGENIYLDNSDFVQLGKFGYRIQRELVFEPQDENNRMHWVIRIFKENLTKKIRFKAKWTLKSKTLKPRTLTIDVRKIRELTNLGNEYDSHYQAPCNEEFSDSYNEGYSDLLKPFDLVIPVDEEKFRIYPDSLMYRNPYDYDDYEESFNCNCSSYYDPWERGFKVFSSYDPKYKAVYYSQNFKLVVEREPEELQDRDFRDYIDVDSVIYLRFTTIEQIKPEVKVIFQDENGKPITKITDLPDDLNVVLSLVNRGSGFKSSESFIKADVSSLSSSGEGLKHTFDKMDFDTSYYVKATANENVFEAAKIDDSLKDQHKYTVTFKKKSLTPATKTPEVEFVFTEADGTVITDRSKLPADLDVAVSLKKTGESSSAVSSVLYSNISSLTADKKITRTFAPIDATLAYETGYTLKATVNKGDFEVPTIEVVDSAEHKFKAVFKKKAPTKVTLPLFVKHIHEGEGAPSRFTLNKPTTKNSFTHTYYDFNTEDKFIGSTNVTEVKIMDALFEKTDTKREISVKIEKIGDEAVTPETPFVITPMETQTEGTYQTTNYEVKLNTEKNSAGQLVLVIKTKKKTTSSGLTPPGPILPTPDPEPTPTPPVTPTPTPTPTPEPVSPLPTPEPVLPEPTPIPPFPTIITPEEDIIPLSSVTLVDEPEAEVPVLPDVVIPSDEEIENLDIVLDETPRGNTDIGNDGNPKGNSILAKTGGLMNRFLEAILVLSALLAILFLSFFKKKS